MSQIQKVHLTYFPLRGVVEKLRLVLEAGGIPYEETRYYSYSYLLVLPHHDVVHHPAPPVSLLWWRRLERTYAWWHNPTPG
jgi:hypothetical protein